MDKKEIEHQIKRYETVRDCAEERLNELNLQLRDLDKAEQPKLRHGAFGMFKDCSPRLIVKEKVYDSNGLCGNACDIDFYTIFGNIFDLTKGWGEDFEEYDKSMTATGIKIKHDQIELYSCTGDSCSKIDDCCHFSIEAAEEFWHSLGHALMTLKRKQS